MNSVTRCPATSSLKSIAGTICAYLLGAAILFASNAAATPEAPGDVLATGAPQIVVEADFAGGELSDGVSIVPFLRTVVGITSNRNLTIRNIGSATLSGLSASLSDTSEFEFVSLGKTALEPGESTSLRLAFHPTGRGIYLADLEIASNAAEHSPFHLVLQGEGVLRPGTPALTPGTVPENAPAGTTVGSLGLSVDEGGGVLKYFLVPGAGSEDNRQFTIAGAELKTAAKFDFETKSSYQVRVRVVNIDAALAEAALTVTVLDGNDAPSAVTLIDAVKILPEDTDTTFPIKLAEIVVTDDSMGPVVLSVSGADATSFSIVGTELFLNAGVLLDFETRKMFAVLVQALDPSLDGTPGASATFTLSVSDVDEGAVVKAVGRNDKGQLGIGTTGGNQFSALPLVTTERLDQIAGANGFAVGRTTDGRVFAWGAHSPALFGGGNAVRVVPTPVTTGVLDGRGASMIAAGPGTCYALLDDGTVAAWGRNSFGQLGNGTTVTSAVPVRVQSLEGVAGVSPGNCFSLALLADGTVRAWGRNSFGQLGDNTQVDRLTPVAVSGLSNVIAVAGGGTHSLALLADGTVRAWGYKASGQLGNSQVAINTAPQKTPVPVSGLDDVVQIAAGWTHSVARKADGTVWVWGNNSQGQLGQGTTVNSKIPVQVPGITSAVEIDAGWDHTVVRLADGTVRAFGANAFGQLGDGTTLTRTMPVPVPGITECSGIAAGESQTFYFVTDATSGAPLLTSPGTGTSYGGTILVDFTLPESAQAGSLKLAFSGPATVTLTLASSMETGGPHSFSLSAHDLASAPEVAAVVGGEALPAGIYTVTLSYQDAVGNAAASASNTAVNIDTAAPVGGTLAILPGSLVNGSTEVTLAMTNWTDQATPLSYQFFLDDTPLGPPQAGNTFIMPPLDPGPHQVSAEVRDGFGNASTAGPLALVVDDLAPVVTAPGALSVPATSADGAPIFFDVAMADDFDPNPSVTIDPPSGSLFPVGDTEVLIMASDAAGNVSTATFTVTVTAGIVTPGMPAVTLTLPAGNAVNGAFTIAGSVKEKYALASFTVKFNGTPMPLTIDPRAAFVPNASVAFSVENVTPTPGPNVITVEAVNVYGKKKTLNRTVGFVNSRPHLAGSYQALLTARGSAPTLDSTGLVAVTVTAAGSFSGKATLNGVSIAFGGYLENDGSARFKPDFSRAFNLVDRTEQDSYLGALSFTISASKEIEGSLTTHHPSGNLGVVRVISTFAGPVAPYSRSNPVRTMLLNLPAGPAPTKGGYTVVFPSKGQAPARALSSYPQGDGFARLTLTQAGAVTLVGMLADGTKYSASARFRADDTAALFTQLYRKLGFFTGKLAFADRTVSDVSGANLHWLRPALRSAQHYSSGWSDIRVDAVGAKYNRPHSLDFGQGAADPVNGNALIVFTDGQLSRAVLKPVSIDPSTGAAKLIPANDTTYRLSFAPDTGLFRGTFPHSDGVATAFRGILLSKGANQGGFGYFLSVPALKVGTTGQSGGVSIEP